MSDGSPVKAPGPPPASDTGVVAVLPLPDVESEAITVGDPDHPSAHSSPRVLSDGTGSSDTGNPTPGWAFVEPGRRTAGSPRSLTPPPGQIAGKPKSPTSLPSSFTRKRPSVSSAVSHGEGDAGTAPKHESRWSVGRLREWIGRPGSPKKSPHSINPEALRPSGLPPKTEKEAREHARKVEELRRDHERLARKRDEAERRRQRQMAEKEKFLAEAREIWLTEILPDWDTQWQTTRARKLWLKGLPQSIRTQVWPLAIGNGLGVTPELFEILKARAMEARRLRAPMSPASSASTPSERPSEDVDAFSSPRDDAPNGLAAPSLAPSGASTPTDSPREAAPGGADTPLPCGASATSDVPHPDPSGAPVLGDPSMELSPVSSSHLSAEQLEAHLARSKGEGAGEVAVSKEDSAGLIPLDLRRTFPHLAFYREGEDHDNLYNVLDAYVYYRPDVGYVQGMTYLAALLLLYMRPYPAFVCLVNMLSKYHFLSFFRMDLREMNVHLLTFDLLLKELLPPVHEAFRSCGLRVEFYCIDWFVTLYSKSLPLDIAARAWDLFFLDPDHLYKIGIGILKYFVKHFTHTDFDDMLQFLTHLPKKINEEDFFAAVASLRIPSGRLAALKHEAQRTATNRIG